MPTRHGRPGRLARALHVAAAVDAVVRRAAAAQQSLARSIAQPFTMPDGSSAPPAYGDEVAVGCSVGELVAQLQDLLHLGRAFGRA